MFVIIGERINIINITYNTFYYLNNKKKKAGITPLVIIIRSSSMPYISVDIN